MAVSHLKVTFVDVVKCRIAIVEIISFFLLWVLLLARSKYTYWLNIDLSIILEFEENDAQENLIVFFIMD